jgi:hypothetical protein
MGERMKYKLTETIISNTTNIYKAKLKFQQSTHSNIFK